MKMILNKPNADEVREIALSFAEMLNERWPELSGDPDWKPNTDINDDDDECPRVALRLFCHECGYPPCEAFYYSNAQFRRETGCVPPMCSKTNTGKNDEG